MFSDRVSEHDVALARTASELPLPINEIPEEWTEHFAALCEHIEDRMRGSRPRTFDLLMRIFNDLNSIRGSAPRQHAVLMAAMQDYPASYATVGRRLGISKVTAYILARRAEKKFDWVKHLFDRQDERRMKPRAASTEVNRLVHGDNSQGRRVRGARVGG